MRSVLLLASLAVAGCAALPTDQIQEVMTALCDGLPVAKEGACVRGQLDDRDPDWQQKGGADIYKAMLTAYDQIGAEVASGTLTERQGEERMAGVKTALYKAANKSGAARKQAIADALASAGITAQ
jgi:hypothetical protein